MRLRFVEQSDTSANGGAVEYLLPRDQHAGQIPDGLWQSRVLRRSLMQCGVKGMSTLSLFARDGAHAMPINSASEIGTVKRLRRYAVKSMQGEDLDEAPVIDGGILGDRAYALVDTSTGKIASAKHPQKWREIIQFGASFVRMPTAEAPLPPITLTCPDGSDLNGDREDFDAEISKILGREVTLTSVRPEAISVDRLDPLAEDESIADIGTFMMRGRFADYAAIHLVSTASLAKLARLYPDGDFDVRRFRPNVIVATSDEQSGFVENEWVGRVITIGNEVRLRITDPTPRCAIPTLAQRDLPKDPKVLRTVADHNQAAVPAFDGAELPCVGVYAFVEQSGTLRKGDPVRID